MASESPAVRQALPQFGPGCRSISPQRSPVPSNAPESSSCPGDQAQGTAAVASPYTTQEMSATPQPLLTVCHHRVSQGAGRTWAGKEPRSRQSPVRFLEPAQSFPALPLLPRSLHTWTPAPSPQPTSTFVTADPPRPRGARRLRRGDVPRCSVRWSALDGTQ